MIRRLLGSVLLLLLLFLVVELSYRVYVTGPGVLNPFKANSFNTLLRSEYVQPSAYPEVFFELKPNMQGWYKGVRFWTNSAGQADKEYSRIKPVDTFRIAVVGSSWTMPSSVSPDKAWHAVLEAKLSDTAMRPGVEVINFGAELYGLREIVGVVRHKVFEWDPDLIVVEITKFTASIVWESDTAARALPPRAYPFFNSYLVRATASVLHLPEDMPARDRPLIDKGDTDTLVVQLERAFRELGAQSKATGVPVVAVFLGFYALSDDVEALLQEFGERFGVRVIFANRIFGAEEDALQYQVSIFDYHPNNAGHELIAYYVGKALHNQQLLPAR
jgi:hypothetical protein